MEEHKLAVEMARQDEQVKTLFRRIDEIQNDVRDVQKLATSVEKLATSIDTMTKGMEKMEIKVDTMYEQMHTPNDKILENNLLSVTKDINEVKKEPGEKWKKLTWDILKIVVGAVIGAALLKIGLTL